MLGLACKKTMYTRPDRHERLCVAEPRSFFRPAYFESHFQKKRWSRNWISHRGWLGNRVQTPPLSLGFYLQTPVWWHGRMDQWQPWENLQWSVLGDIGSLILRNMISHVLGPQKRCNVLHQWLELYRITWISWLVKVKRYPIKIFACLIHCHNSGYFGDICEDTKTPTVL